MSKIKIYDRYFGKQLPIRERFYNIIFTLGFLGGATGMIACMMLGSSSEAIITSGAMAIYMPGMMFISSIDKKHQKQLMSFAILFLKFV